jgi:hypothetical protein
MTLISLSPTWRRAVARVDWYPPKGLCRTPLLVDDTGKPVPAHLEVFQTHPDGTAQALHAGVLSDIPAVGWRTYSLEEANGRKQPELQAATATMDGDRAVLDNGLLRAEVGPDGVQIVRGGKAVFAAPAGLAGLFGDGPKVSHFTDISANTEDNLSAVAKASGAIGPVGLSLHVILRPYATSASFIVTCNFGEGPQVGEGPDDPPLMAPWSHEDRKLRWVFPLRMTNPQFLAHGAFELRKPSRPIWPITGMALAQGDGGGLALYPDRTTSAVFRQDPAEMDVILAYGGKFIYAPGDSAPLTGVHHYSLVVYPYAGTPEGADVAALACGSAYGPNLIWRPGKAFATPSGSLIAIMPANAAVMTDCERQGSDLVFRMWRPYPGEAQVKLTFAGAKSLSVADLAGRPTKPLASGSTATMTLRSEQIVTLRAALGAK